MRFSEKKAVQSAAVAVLWQALMVLTTAGLYSGIGIARARRRHGARSPFKVLMPYTFGVSTVSEAVGVIRSLICSCGLRKRPPQKHNSMHALHEGTHHQPAPSGTGCFHPLELANLWRS